MKPLLSTVPFVLVSGSHSSPYPSGLTLPISNDLAHQHYLINISVGTPPSLYTVMLDTGSTDFWLPAWNSSGCLPNPCKPGTYNPSDSSTAVDIGVPFNVSYGLTPGSGWLGEYYNESISLGNAVLPSQTFATANVPSPITPSTFWGILGLGSRYGTASFSNPYSPIFHQLNATYNPLWESLYTSGLVPRRLFSIHLGQQSAVSGTITLGGIEEPGRLYTGNLTTTPVIRSNPSFANWAITLTSVSRTTPQTNSSPQNTTLLTPSSSPIPVILDTGSPNMYLPPSLYTAITTPLTPTYHPNPEGNPTPYVPCTHRTTHPPTHLTFTFAPTPNAPAPTIHVPLPATILPFGLPANLGKVRGERGEELCYLGIVETPGPVFLLGATFLQSVYAVFSGEGEEWVVSMGQGR